MLEEARGAERDYHGNRGDGTKVRQRSADHTRGVSSTDAESGPPHVGATVGDLSERRGAARAQCRFGRKIKGQRRTRSGKESRWKSILLLQIYFIFTYIRVVKKFDATTYVYVTVSSITGIRRRGSSDGGPGQDLPRVGEDASRFRKLLHASRQR